MKEDEVFTTLQRIEIKLDRLAECRVDDLKMLNSALEKKVDSDTFDKIRDHDVGIMQWLMGGVAAVLLAGFGYAMMIRSDITKLDGDVQHHIEVSDKQYNKLNKGELN